MTDKTKKFVMILEKSSQNLHVATDGEDVVLEGVFAQFGIVNNNDRIYEESEYLPHIEYLNKKIESKRLLGELDHPEKFDISLSKVSHIIEKLEYIKESRQVRGRVRLLDTPTGRIAKELVKSGVPISISSRAAGIVESNKKVKIKRIFTYDLVSDPGFETAVLERINESLGIHNNLISIFETDEDLNKYFLEEENDIQKTNEQMEFVTPKELHDYSLLVKKEIEKINENIDTLKEESKDDKINRLSENVIKIEKYLEYLAGVSDKTIQYAEYIGEQVENVSDTLGKAISYTEYIGEHIDNNIAYTKYVAEKLDQSIQYSEYIKETVENNISYSDYLAEKLNQGISYSEHIAESATESLEKLEESFSEIRDYSNYLGEELDKGISYTEYVAEQTQAVADYAEYTINEHLKMNESEIAEEEKVPEAEEEKAPEAEEETKNEEKNENIQTETSYSTLSEKVDNLIKSVKKQKTEDVNESMKHGQVKLPNESIIYGFVELLSESKREEFRNLDESSKKKVTSALNGKTLKNEEDVIKIWESTLSPSKERWIEEAPEKYKQLWSSLDESQKRTIIAQSRTYKLETDYQIKNFWETRSSNLLTNKIQTLNESKEEKIPTLGYSKEYLEYIKTLLEKK